ncbi:MAG: phosphotriesterase-related protein, partial [Acidobacteria bacterium]|nr:phosphotriesterase-related protein [Acidobacteriota bacterium]
IRKLAKTPLDAHIEAIRRQIDKGLLKNLLFSQDVCSLKQLVANGGYGYAHIIRNVLPKLRAAGVTAGQIDEITVQNPRRLLAGV